MPELRAGVPQSLPVNEQTFMDAITYYGITWLSVIAYKFPSTSVPMDVLADEPAPPPTDWNAFDTLSALQPPGPWDTATHLKMLGLVRSFLYATKVVETAGDPLPPPPTAPPVPTDLPPAPPPITDLPTPDPITDNFVQLVKLLHRLESQLTWARKQLPTREYIKGGPVTVTGHGETYWGLTSTGGSDDYDVAPIGFCLTITAKPGFAGHSEPPEPQIWYRLGTVSWGDLGWMSPPINITRLHLMIFPIELQGFTVYYALADGVTAQLAPLYPTQWDGTRPD